MEKCPYSKKCGGCNAQYIDREYEDSLKDKEKKVRKLLTPFGKVEPILAAENPYHYRNKVHAVVGQDRYKNIIMGTYEKGTHHVVNVPSCLLDDERADAIIRSIGRLMVSFHYQAYNEDTRKGFLRHILIRIGRTSGEIMVTLVVADPRFPSKNNFVKALMKEHPEITTILMNVNAGKTSMILGEKEEVLYGKGYIVDSLCNKTFRISSKSFYQIHKEQCEQLYRLAYEMAELTGTEEVMDAYSGIGTIGIGAGDYVKSVIGIELNPDAVKDAIDNCKRNKATNCRYYTGDAGEYMTMQARKGKNYDVVFMDPPRSGSDEAFLKALVKAEPKKIVYISCNPDTLARDLQYLTKHGYRMKRCKPVDMFCFTEHVETVVLLSKGVVDKDNFRKVKVDFSLEDMDLTELRGC